MSASWLPRSAGLTCLHAHAPGPCPRSTAQVLARRRIPVLIVHGVAVLIVPPANSARLAAQLPGARLVSRQGMGGRPCPGSGPARRLPPAARAAQHLAARPSSTLQPCAAHTLLQAVDSTVRLTPTPTRAQAAWQGVGHMPHEEQPQRFVQEVAAWLAEVLERRA